MPVSGSTRPGTPTPIAAMSSGRCVGVGEGAADDRGDLVDRAILGAGRGRGDLAGQDTLVAIDDEDGDLAAADVDADEERPVVAVEAGAGIGAVRHRCTVRPSSRVSRSAHAPRSVRSSPIAAIGDAGLARERSETAARGLVADGRQPRLAQGGDRAVDDDLADVEDADQVGDRGAEGAARGARDGQRGLVAGVGRGGQFGECPGR